MGGRKGGWELEREVYRKGGRRREEWGREGMREVTVTSSKLLSHRPLDCSISGNIHYEGKPGNESTTEWDIPVLDFTTLLLRDIADGGKQ